ncbi:hypothetical protein DEI97_008430 [Curtobacterium sp. MCLR17_032]|uniref:hypothetical protein n=1 Tax=Curtobacterium sp. MCLR17_032 TaxID=2175650 RepID=UPI000DAA556C|nr:hypothetical protein [Curtobacterium sp. MCLR17_032]WIE63152.1 hypothetical protein DEI97_008430 [Curtobacterium sp. MCLR17_032]
MGYQVYEDPNQSWRWAGYAVPAECDWDGCATRIDRGLAYKCEDHGDYVLMLDGEEITYDRYADELDAEEVWQEHDGFGSYFCPDHKARTGEHTAVQPKPDSLEGKRTSSLTTPGPRGASSTPLASESCAPKPCSPRVRPSEVRPLPLPLLRRHRLPRHRARRRRPAAVACITCCSYGWFDLETGKPADIEPPLFTLTEEGVLQ